ncbi:hypothetical protein OPV22_032508 [Ensete ventricosum]|uniref:Uncharacterized protein n=1 Tax=Ensete ventricosum TaxID=4639 RepID=A0AAV8PWS8_ENSVE|nr:hypothetical protein OPV22_032508 [Ensete ventricosum]
MKPRGVEEMRLAVVNKLEEVESAPAEEVVVRRREEVDSEQVAVVVNEPVEVEVSRWEKVENEVVVVVNRPVMVMMELEEVVHGPVAVVNRLGMAIRKPEVAMGELGWVVESWLEVAVSELVLPMTLSVVRVEDAPVSG